MIIEFLRIFAIVCVAIYCGKIISKFKMPVTKQLVDYLREQELTFTVNDA